MFARETAASGRERLCVGRKKDQSKREREGREGPLGPMCESENAIDGSQAARDDRRMTACLWIDTGRQSSLLAVQLEYRRSIVAEII